MAPLSELTECLKEQSASASPSSLHLASAHSTWLPATPVQNSSHHGHHHLMFSNIPRTRVGSGLCDRICSLPLHETRISLGCNQHLVLSPAFLALSLSLLICLSETILVQTHLPTRGFPTNSQRTRTRACLCLKYFSHCGSLLLFLLLRLRLCLFTEPISVSSTGPCPGWSLLPLPLLLLFPTLGLTLCPSQEAQDAFHDGCSVLLRCSQTHKNKL